MKCYLNYNILKKIIVIILFSFLNIQATFSIVAIDTTTGEIGSAGASCISNSIILSAIHPGVGAIHTQAYWNSINQDSASFLMNLGSSSSIGFYSPKNFIHIVLDNFSYQSTGNQPSVSEKIDLCNIATSSGYKIVDEFKKFNSRDIDLNTNELTFYRIHVSKESSEDISRVSHAPNDIMMNFRSIL
mgnify:CR=1 FL=1